MPLEIRELIIKVTVKENNSNTAATNTEELLLDMKNRIVKECMEKILLKLERQNDR